MTFGYCSLILKAMRAILLLLLLFSAPAMAGTVSRLYDFEPNTKAQADQVDAELNNIISTINGNLDTSNLAIGAFGTSNIKNYSITTIKLVTDSVTTAKIADGAVTPSKLSTANYVTASISNGMTITGTSGIAQIASATITSYGRPIVAKLTRKGVTASNILVTGSGTFSTVTYEMFLDSVRMGYVTRQYYGLAATPWSLYTPCTDVGEFVTTPAPGSHTVTASAYMQFSNGITFFGCALSLFEE